MISVVLPVYNGEDSLKKSIDSVLGQTHTDLELIIVNDCSTDGTSAIISEAMERDKRIRRIDNQTNQKLPNSLNIGFSHAKGEYFTWTSHDKMYHKDALKMMYEALENDEKIGMVYCDFVAIDVNDREIAVYRQDEPECLAWKNPVGACFLYRKEVAQKVGDYDKDLFLAEDYEYWLRIWEVSKIVHLPQILYYYRQHQKSLTETRKQEIKHKTVEVWLKHWDYNFSHINGKKDKLRFCIKLMEMEKADLRKGLFLRLIKSYTLFLCYYIFIKIKNRGK